jgi:hypothetical protein
MSISIKYKIKIILSFLFIIINLISIMHADKQKMIICVPVTDLRSECVLPPKLRLPALPDYNPLEDSQLLFNEYVLGEDLGNGWLRIQAPEQWTLSEDRWVFYPGYILKAHAMPVAEFPRYNLVVTSPLISVNFHGIKTFSSKKVTLYAGTRLPGTYISRDKIWEVEIVSSDNTTYLGYIEKSFVLETLSTEQDPLLIDEEKLREFVVSRARSFLGMPYCWGGRSTFDPEERVMFTSLDCSGLVYTVYRSLGLFVPRDAGKQRMYMLEISHGANLKPGDLIFFEPHGPKGLKHIAIYTGDNKFIESQGLFEPGLLREISSLDHPGIRVPVTKLKSGTIISHDDLAYTIFFGSLLCSLEKRIEMRTRFLDPFSLPSSEAH